MMHIGPTFNVNNTVKIACMGKVPRSISVVTMPYFSWAEWRWIVRDKLFGFGEVRP
jgi:hypothetical protein